MGRKSMVLAIQLINIAHADVPGHVSGFSVALFVLLQFTAIGKGVNIAAHLEEMTKEVDFDVLVTEATARRVTDGVVWTEVGTFPVHGCREPIRVLSLGRA